MARRFEWMTCSHSDRASGQFCRLWAVAITLNLLGWNGGVLTFGESALALPPPEEVPEEVLREEVILQGRSPIDGSPLSPVEYAELEEELGEFPEGSVAVNPEIQSLVFQLKLLRLLKDVVPFWD